MLFYPVARPDVTPSGAEDAGLSLLGQAGMVAVRVADLASPAGPGLGRDGGSALVVAGAGEDPQRGSGGLPQAGGGGAGGGPPRRAQAAGHPADHARLGVAEERIDALAGRRDVIGQIAAGVTLQGKVKGVARRAVTPALAIRFTLLMTLMPSDADYAEVMAALMGDLAAVPWQRPCTLPTATVACTWREALGPGPLEQLRDRALAGVDAEHRDHDYRAVIVGDLDTCSIDGSLTRVPDTPANRQAFGSAWTADDSSPYPRQRDLWLSHASTRAALAVASGPSGAAASGGRDKGEAEQALLDHPRQISFTAARRAIITTTRTGAATAACLPRRSPRTASASWPAWAAVSMWIATGTATARPKRGWASRRAARAFPPRLRSPRSASASRSPPEPCPSCRRTRGQSRLHPPALGTGRSPERQPGCSHVRPPQSLSVEHPTGHIGQRSVSPERPITLFYMALGGARSGGTEPLAA